MKRTAWLAAAILLAAGTANAGEDKFDFYVLSLAWSPSYCMIEGSQADRGQCGRDRDLTFIVHGLWPQFERGYPKDCESGEPRRVPQALAATMLDIMPSVGLIGHEWRAHGTCTGLTQADYLAATRAAFGRISLPASLDRSTGVQQASPEAIEQAFMAANPGLTVDGVATTCERGLLDEVRICLTRDMQFRRCPEIDRDSCRAPTVRLPPAP